jgi:hypothetical protein
MDAQIKGQLNQTIYVAERETIDYQTGELRYGDVASYDARVEGRMIKILNFKGDESVSHQQVILEGPITYDASDIIWLPDDDQTDWNQGHNPQAIKNAVDENGNHDFSVIFL